VEELSGGVETHPEIPQEAGAVAFADVVAATAAPTIASSTTSDNANSRRLGFELIM
jgi:hypothetical protein